MDIPIFHTEEGRYLAKSLGDPLIKGLTEVANVKPKDPVAFLATFLHNFPAQEKPRLGTQETNIIVTKETPEMDNEHLPPVEDEEETSMKNAKEDRARTAALTATRKIRPIDVIAVEANAENNSDAPETATSSANRDEHGQSMLHFAAARTHTNNALFQLLQESDVSLGFRDELYRTARDVSIQANVLENTSEIDRWVLHLAARGKTDKIMELLLQGYDHILDIVDDEGVPISEVVAQRGDDEMNNLLTSIPAFEESRETLHGAVRRGDLDTVQEIVSAEGGRTLVRAQNTFGRNALHIAVLAQHEEIVAYLSENCSELLRLGDNLERTPLHYAMGVNKMESLSYLLIQAGAKRVLKDLKGRQPSYYFMNKSEILRLKEEEEAY
ncbi:jg1655 [Pararge aegeria aegeria]|uniref:Jg1655 protein n=1 Tax=Pararge aegeria aegeria TaxID=348720 RepID=A0A8S4RBF8_9NEOP|nr:jg1655 [Pararge aegeria aegeria]